MRGGVDSGEIYSTEETRVGTWIDGKPVYRRVFKDTLNSDNVIAVLPDVQEIVYLGGVVAFGSGITDLSCTYSAAQKAILIYKTNENVLNLTYLGNATSFTAIIEYTKTTD